ncbi:histidine phosphatase family protein [Microbulbifer hydrolyticus]|uniref:Broad specificity phosphatase PhoE n=1 Tax=Microbulbifer hydrolyticus TaxID=48074 RepID=A0A6P1TAF1_9GAMM|nr:histidine phosphatase family protein [Microbulbifer hydrolyticus]MBB5210810.1 broad specificity phosphatase PhoE [Microbulbifer hydrolyticus]QHQ38751.1 hypothetical protein GTQ55_06965 [Microbulbifer hydrolyticus]
MHQIILVRHGEAAKSGADADPGLTEQGQQEAEALIPELDKRFPGGTGVRLVSSPKSRAMQTAIPIATHWGKEIHETADVIEIPSPQGMPLEERGAWIRQLLHNSWDSLSPAQDQWRDRLMRYLLTLDSGAAAASTHTTLIFCHFMVINSVVATLRNDAKVAQFFPDYTSLTHLNLHAKTLTLVELGRERNGKGEHRIQ